MSGGLNEAELIQLSQLRELRVGAGALIAFLKGRREVLIAKACSYYRAGDISQIPFTVAELTAIDDMLTNLEQKNKRVTHLENKDKETQ